MADCKLLCASCLGRTPHLQPPWHCGGVASKFLQSFVEVAVSKSGLPPAASHEEFVLEAELAKAKRAAGNWKKKTKVLVAAGCTSQPKAAGFGDDPTATGKDVGNAEDSCQVDLEAARAEISDPRAPPSICTGTSMVGSRPQSQRLSCEEIRFGHECATVFLSRPSLSNPRPSRNRLQSAWMLSSRKVRNLQISRLNCCKDC